MLAKRAHLAVPRRQTLSCWTAFQLDSLACRNGFINCCFHSAVFKSESDRFEEKRELALAVIENLQNFLSVLAPDIEQSVTITTGVLHLL